MLILLLLLFTRFTTVVLITMDSVACSHRCDFKIYGRKYWLPFILQRHCAQKAVSDEAILFLPTQSKPLKTQNFKIAFRHYDVSTLHCGPTWLAQLIRSQLYISISISAARAVQFCKIISSRDSRRSRRRVLTVPY